MSNLIMGKLFFISAVLAFSLATLTECSEENIFINGENEPEGQGPIEGGEYYVATWGSDNNPGTYEKPWASLQKAVNNAKAGDVVFIRGGIYYPTKTIELNPERGYGNNGTSNNYICFFNYPSESPVFDFANFNPSGNYITGFYLVRANFIHLKGLTIRNVEQKRDYMEAIGIYAYNSSNLIFENMTVHDCGGNAFRYAGAMGYYDIEYDSTYFINCDAYNNCDSRPRSDQGSSYLGGAADGFKTWNEPGSYFEFRGCRAWNNSDDGFDPSTDAMTVIDQCWSFKNGYLEGDGTGFKTGGILHEYSSKIMRIVKNCIAAENSASGFFLLEYPDYYRTNARIYNNFSYANGNNGYSVSRNEVHPIILAVWQNNIAYKNEDFPFGNSYQKYTESYNNWDRVDGYPGYVYSDVAPVSDNDFLSLDIDQLSNPRQPDGSLPIITFGHLADDSDLNNAGTYIGMSKNPDIGVDWKYLGK